MKIAIIITNLGAGGAERVATLQADFLQDYHQVSLITLEDSLDHYTPKHPGVKRVRLLRDDADELYSVIKKENLDLVIDHIHWSEHHYHFLNLLAKKQFPFIIFDHNSYFYPLFFDFRHSMFLERNKVYRKASAVTCLTRHTCALFRNELKNVVVMHNALSYESDKVSDLADETVIAVANWERPEKRMWCILKTFSYVASHRPNVKLLLVGPSNSSLVMELCHEYDIDQNRVEIIGKQAEVESYYLRSSVALLTSEVEGFGLVLTEAAMHGIPRVVMNVYGLEDVVYDGKDGYIVPDGDCKGAASRIVKLFNEPELRKKMGKQARISSAQFKIKIIGQRWLWLIDTVFKKSKKEQLAIFDHDCSKYAIDEIPREALLTDCIQQFYRFILSKRGQKAYSINRDFTFAILNNYRISLTG